jgi:hypothetical protein
MQGSAELREIGDKVPIVRRYISDYGKLRDAIRLLRKKRKNNERGHGTTPQYL